MVLTGSLSSKNFSSWLGDNNAYLQTVVKVKQYCDIKCVVECLTPSEQSINTSWCEQGKPVGKLSSTPHRTGGGEERIWEQQVVTVGRKPAGQSLGLREERKEGFGELAEDPECPMGFLLARSLGLPQLLTYQPSGILYFRHEMIYGLLEKGEY